ENSGKQEASWPVLHRTSRSQHVACPAEKDRVSLYNSHAVLELTLQTRLQRKGVKTGEYGLKRWLIS
ncbi:hypothetical protein LEMLEM_LOCUS16180, partial [Lemmus lemmus]